MTKTIDIPEDPSPQDDPDKPIFDRGEGARKEPMTLAQLEAKIPEWNAKQRKTKPKPIVVYTPKMHRELDAGNAAYRKRAAGSETARRAIQRLGRIVGDHGAHSIRGLYGTPKDAPKDAPLPTYQQPKEVAQGRCAHCNTALPKVGVRPDIKFCPDKPCQRAFQYREKLRNEANRHFKDYRESAQAKADAELAARALRFAAADMTASAIRAGITGATFMATPTGILAPAGIDLPPVRCRIFANKDDARLGRVSTQRLAEVKLTPVPEHGAVLYEFDFPFRRPGDIGKEIAIETRFMGDLGAPDHFGQGCWKHDAYPTPEQEAVLVREKAREQAEEEAWRIEFRAQQARREADRVARKARGGPGTTSAREAHAEERMRNLLARPDHDRIIAEMEADGSWEDLREFYRARRAQETIRTHNTKNRQSKQ